MRTIIDKLAAAALVISAAFGAQSCTDNDNASYDRLIPNALVTVKPEGNSFYIQLDDSTIIRPTNAEKFNFDEETRAFANFDFPKQPWGSELEIEAFWITPTLTKQPVETLGSSEADKEEYGEDPVELVRMWTVCEDGYLSLQFRTYWSRYGNIKHAVNLVTGVDPDDPYTVEFRHDACGDYPEVVSDGYVSFRLNCLPDTKGETVKLKVKYRSETGEKTVEFDYKTRPGDEDITE
ncbi:MAG: NigD-like protein [Candidatus Cryptobacteroides sp.]